MYTLRHYLQKYDKSKLRSVLGNYLRKAYNATEISYFGLWMLRWNTFIQWLDTKLYIQEEG